MRVSTGGLNYAAGVAAIGLATGFLRISLSFMTSSICYDIFAY